MVRTRRIRQYDDHGDELPVTEAGFAALQPKPMTPEQVHDLVERTRAADIAAGLTQEVKAKMSAGARRGGEERAKRYRAERAAAQADLEARRRYERLTSGACRRR